MKNYFINDFSFMYILKKKIVTKFVRNNDYLKYLSIK